MTGAEIAWIGFMLVANDLASGGKRSIPIRVEFVAPAGCSGVEAFYAGLLSRSPRARRAGAEEDGLELIVRLERNTGRVRGELRVPGASDTRTVYGDRCDEVVDVLSLTAALAIEGPARQPPAHPQSKPKPLRPPAAISESARPLPDSPLVAIESAPRGAPPSLATTMEGTTATAPPHLTIGVAASTVGGRVVAPSVELGGALSARITLVRSGGIAPSVSVAALYLSNDLVQSATDFAARLTAAGVTGCPGWSTGGAIAVEPCVQALGGLLTATGRGLTNPASVSRAWWSIGALARASTVLSGRLSLELEAGFFAPLIHRRFVTTTPARTVAETSSVSAMAAIGVSCRL